MERIPIGQRQFSTCNRPRRSAAVERSNENARGDIERIRRCVGVLTLAGFATSNLEPFLAAWLKQLEQQNARRNQMLAVRDTPVRAAMSVDRSWPP
ncbi:TPA: hypothetical protein QDB13_000668 [Burkholderia vietnamiensis]|nr:hypothetical protein [Burkholderia vietnamiensis]